MSDYKARRAIFRAIEKVRKSQVLLYVTGDRRQLETQISPGVSGILWARHIMRGREDGYATQEEHGRRSGSGPRAAA